MDEFGFVAQAGSLLQPFEFCTALQVQKDHKPVGNIHGLF